MSFSGQTDLAQPQRSRHQSHRNNPVEAGAVEIGLTLIEVLIALVIVSIGLLAIAGLQARAIEGNRSARMQTEATALASRTLEQLRLLPFDHPDLDPGAAPHRILPDGKSPYSVLWKVLDDEPVAGTKTVQVRVEWLGCSSGHTVELRTIVADKLR